MKNDQTTTPETDAELNLFLRHGEAHQVSVSWIDFCRKLERERDEERKQNAYLRCIAERAIDYLDQSYRDGFSDEASELRYELKQLKEGGK